jgi:drug/metabolite transporter (DMT)-like permease
MSSFNLERLNKVSPWPLLSLAELTLASVLWGFGFIATVWALKELSPSAIIFYRFGVAGLVVVLIMLARGQWAQFVRELKRAWLAGLIIGATLVFQSWGLVYTTATKSSFITTLYVIIVPIFSALFFKERLARWHWLFVTIALVGMILILELRDFSLGLGDSLTLVNAFLAAIHILVVGRISSQPTHAFAFNGGQALWCAALALPPTIIEGNWGLTALSSQTWWGLIALTFGSSLVAFYFQVKAQKDLSPSVASLLFLLESPFSWAFAIYFLGENPSWIQGFGALLILIACTLTALTEAKKAKPSP